MSKSLVPGVFTTQQARARLPIFYDVQASQRPFPLDYKGYNYVYMFSAFPANLTVSGYGQVFIPGNAWVPIPFPETTQINIPNQTTYSDLTVMCSDVPIVQNIMQLPRIIVELFQLNEQNVGNSFSTGPLVASQYSELAIDFSVYSISGGSSPGVTFAVSRLGLDGVYYQLEKATALTAAGTISYSIGAGLDGKSFAGTFKVDMVTTGNPTSVTISGSIKAKQ